MEVDEFLRQTDIMLDVRTPSEFLQGHIPGAVSFPLFSDEERKRVGTVYKQKGKEDAVKLGLSLVGPHLLSFVEKTEFLVGPSRKVRLYCARGGMRSSFLAWLLQTAGFDCTLLEQGYKAFRNWALSQFTVSYSFFVLGGFTGSGKTDLLHEIKNLNEQVIDLEQMANHRGSSFGHLGCSPQPSSEHFENILALELSKCDLKRPLWIEDESRMIGLCHVPKKLWNQMMQAPFLWIERSKEERLKRIVLNYGKYSIEDLTQATQRLLKKIGFSKVQKIVQDIQNKEFESAFFAILEYYDKTYSYASQKIPRNRIDFFCIESDKQLVKELIGFSQDRV